MRATIFGLFASLACLFPALGDAQQVTESARSTGVQSETPLESYDSFLFHVGRRLGCYFTLEYRGFRLAGAPSPLVMTRVADDGQVKTIAELLAKLHHDLKDFIAVQDPARTNVIHIIERQVERPEGYVLNKRLSLVYSGNLVACDVMDSAGKNLSHGVGLLAAAATQVPGIRSGTETDGIGGESTIVDCLTTVEVNATNQSLRSIITECLPSSGYNPILWQAVTSIEKGKLIVLVQFMGTTPKGAGR